MPDINYVKLLLEMEDCMLVTELENIPLPEFRKNLKLALKMQDRDTRHACADAVLKMAENDGYDKCGVLVSTDMAHKTIMNTKTIIIRRDHARDQI